MNTKTLFALLSAFVAFGDLSAQVSSGSIEIQGDMSVLNNPQTVQKEGNLTVQNDLGVGGILTANKIKSTNNNNGALSFGENATVVSGSIGIALGMNSLVMGNGAFALGYQAQARGNSSIAVGSNSLASGGSSGSVGSNAKALGGCSFSIGANTQALSDCSFAAGSATIASGKFSFTTGTGSIAYGEESFVGGISSTGNGKGSFTYGKNLASDSFAQTTLGHLNELFESASTTNWILSDPLFVIGNGIPNGVRSNALVILKSGDAKFNGKISSTKPSTGLPMGAFGRPNNQ